MSMTVSPDSADSITNRCDHFELVGTRLAGKYDVLEVVEETSFSVVYRAQHRVWRRPVAIKAFKALMFSEHSREELLESFVREGTLLMELSERCAAICQARDIGSTTTAHGDWVPFMVLEWLEGESLDAVLARERAQSKAPRSLSDAVSLLEPVAQALALAHERGIAHRDIKPGNIFLLAAAGGDAGRCKLLDFGVAKVVGDARAAADGLLARSFTPDYGAPEQFAPEFGPTGPRTDVFALAMVLVELATGREPHFEEGVTTRRLRAGNPRIPRTPKSFGVTVPPAVERVLSRALAVRPGDRFADARAFWLCLKRAMSETVCARERTLPIPLLRRRVYQRRRWVVPAVALIGAAAMVTALQRRGISASAAWIESWSRTPGPGLLAPARAAARWNPSSP
jgi:serine/threonine protein kinase